MEVSKGEGGGHFTGPRHCVRIRKREEEEEKERTGQHVRWGFLFFFLSTTESVCVCDMAVPIWRNKEHNKKRMIFLFYI